MTLALQGAQKPFVGILGGAKLSEQLPVLEVMWRRCDTICVGGGVANTLLAARSVDMKESTVERDQLALGRALLKRAHDHHIDLVLPVDVHDRPVAATPATARASASVRFPTARARSTSATARSRLFARKVAGAQLVLWHGALGVAENAGIFRRHARLARARSPGPRPSASSPATRWAARPPRSAPS